MSVTNQLGPIQRGCADIVSKEELKAKLSLGRQLVMKAGFDPTASDLHLGHTVLLRKLRQFQDLGHKVIFLIGDATGLVGDPTGQQQARRLLSWDEVKANAKTYQEQVRQILLTDPAVFEVRYNSEWFLGRSPQLRNTGLETFDFSKLVTLSSRYTVARLIERDDFSKRLKSGRPLSMLELFYPLMQGYDSVKIAEQHGSCDVELGGTDQVFNLLVGRDLMKEYGFEPQVVLTMPLLEGLDGVNKMSKSLGNHVAIKDPPNEMFGKLMSIADDMIIKYMTLLTDADESYLKKQEQRIKTKQINPRDAKAEMAHMIVSSYHGSEAAERAKEEFLRVFSKKELPADMPVIKIPHCERVDLIEIMVGSGVAKTKNEARRLIKQKAVKIDGKVQDSFEVAYGGVKSDAVLQVGSRKFFKLLK